MDDVDDSLAPFEVRLSQQALTVYLEVGHQQSRDSLDKKLELLGLFPYLGHEYNPIYPAARPPFPVYVTYAGRYGIYYEVSEPNRTITIDYIVDQWRDPLTRFSAQ